MPGGGIILDPFMHVTPISSYSTLAYLCKHSVTIPGNGPFTRTLRENE